MHSTICILSMPRDTSVGPFWPCLDGTQQFAFWACLDGPSVGPFIMPRGHPLVRILTMLFRVWFWSRLGVHAHWFRISYPMYSYIIELYIIHGYLSIRGIHLWIFPIRIHHHTIHTPSPKTDSEISCQHIACIYGLSHYLAILRTLVSSHTWHPCIWPQIHAFVMLECTQQWAYSPCLETPNNSYFDHA